MLKRLQTFKKITKKSKPGKRDKHKSEDFKKVSLDYNKVPTKLKKYLGVAHTMYNLYSNETTTNTSHGHILGEGMVVDLNLLYWPNPHPTLTF